jgi:long-chain acyl-CoA synthetase
VPDTLEYPRATLYEALRSTAERLPHAQAWDFMGKTATYSKLMEEIDRFARGLAARGLRKGGRITISMPTSPQGLIAFYAANKLGAAASMIHPLSRPKEIAFYLRTSKSTHAVTLDAFYPQFREAMAEHDLDTLILSRIPDYLPFPVNHLFRLTKGRKIAPVPRDPRVAWWPELMKGDAPEPDPAPSSADDLAVIMYSGGTTGRPKGIMLSNANFVSEGMMAAAWGGIDEKDSMLAILPIFHGFGLGVCVNAMFMGGGKVILVPRFTAAEVAKLIRSKRPSIIVGVPTLFDALSRDPRLASADLSCLRGAFCGADHLPRRVKERFEAVVRNAGGNVRLLEGYGLTEAVTGIMGTPLDHYREGSIGVPWPDMLAKIVKRGTTKEAEPGEDGEICISGPAVMLGYLDQPEETAAVLRRHDDGKTWLHTGDIGCMDRDGFFYFKLREKRMIKSSGMNVYPAEVEAVLLTHEAVDQACVIGVPDEAQGQRVKGFVVLKDASCAPAGMEQTLIDHCRDRLIKWSCPREIELRTELPKTLIGKVDFKALAEQEVERLKAAGKLPEG